MPFDWDKYRELAEELRQRDDEAAKRSAISRLYYSVYWQARTVLENLGYIYSENKEPHAQIWWEYINKGKIYREIGNNGKRLRNKRNDADYKIDIPKLDDELETSFKWARQILSDLKKIQPKNES